jgi:hypothetical protein
MDEAPIFVLIVRNFGKRIRAGIEGRGKIYFKIGHCAIDQTPLDGVMKVKGDAI